MSNFFIIKKPNEESLGNIFDLLTPEEKSRYAQSFKPTTEERIGNAVGGIADVIASAGGGRNDYHYGTQAQKRTNDRIGQDMQFVGNELTRKYAERQAKAAAEKEARQSAGVGEELGDIFNPKYFDNPNTTGDDKLKIAQFLNQQRIQNMKPTPRYPQQKNPFWDTVDRKFGEDYQDYFARGGYAYAKKNLDQLKDVSSSFGQGKNISGTIGLLPKGMRDIFTPGGAAVQDRIEQTILSTLRQVLGPQFTEKEGRSILEKTFNPRLPEDENKDRLIRLTNQLEKQAMIKDMAANYARDHGTLKGYNGPMMATTADELLDGLSIPQDQDQAKAQTKKGKDGKTYVKKEDGKWYPKD